LLASSSFYWLGKLLLFLWTISFGLCWWLAGSKKGMIKFMPLLLLLTVYEISVFTSYITFRNELSILETANIVGAKVSGNYFNIEKGYYEYRKFDFRISDFAKTKKLFSHIAGVFVPISVRWLADDVGLEFDDGSSMNVKVSPLGVMFDGSRYMIMFQDNTYDKYACVLEKYGVKDRRYLEILYKNQQTEGESVGQYNQRLQLYLDQKPSCKMLLGDFLEEVPTKKLVGDSP
jgi:hypothetical protein